MIPRKCIEVLEPYGYVPGDEEIAKLAGISVLEVKRFDRNTSQNALPTVVNEIRRIAKDGISRIVNEYPDSKYSELTSSIASYIDSDSSQIVLGNGADEIIDMLVRTFISSDEVVVVSTPTFSFYQVAVSVCGGTTVEVPRIGFDFSIDATQLIRAANDSNAKIIFICNPNNPTGNYVPLQTIKKIAEGFDGILAVDEAYIEFSEKESATRLIDEYQNIVVIRTLSKALGLAGMRIGFAVCSPRVAQLLNKIRQPYNINPISERLAIAALSSISEVRQNITSTIMERERISQKLQELGFKVLPSDTNFLLIRTDAPDSCRIFKKLLKKGIVIRNYSGSLSGYLRITVREKDDNNLLLSEIGRINDGILFDVDGVLVDVSKSYREAIKQTVKFFSRRTVLDKEIESIKRLPNSNNDWDVTYALLEKKYDLKNIDRSTKYYREIKDKFQSLYLGKLNKNEKLIISRSTLSRLSQESYKLGIVTSRPRDEAFFVLKELIPEFFKKGSIIASEDCKNEKPNPDPLLLAKGRIDSRAAIYVGDTINDALAAKAAGMAFISVSPELEAENSIPDVNRIFEVLK
jgi:histidinol-phosphate aminotransferase